MTMHEEWTDKLSAYLDGELSNEEQRAVTAHVGECEACARMLDGLRAVVAAAQSVAPSDPAADLWRGIADRIASPEGVRPVVKKPWDPSRRFSYTLPQLAAASLLLALVSGWAALRLIPGGGPQGNELANTAPAPGAGTVDAQAPPGGTPDVALAAGFDDTEYDAAVDDLERALQNGRGRLDPATVKVVEDNLTIIDQAVDEARHALAEDPANAYLSGYLVETRRRKLDLLRRAAALTQDLN